MEIEIEVNYEQYIYVEIDGKIETGNDSFNHEFGTEKYPNYYYVEEFEWDKSKYTDYQNKMIQNYIDENFDNIESGYTKNYNPY